MLIRLVVDLQSATHLCNRRVDAIDADHSQIVKPESTRAKSYLAFKSAYLDSSKAAGDANGPPGKGPNSGLRADLQNVRQKLGSTGRPIKTRSGETVHCDSAELSLVLAHEGNPPGPILINSIAVRIRSLERAELEGAAGCKIDPLSSVPHGIMEKNMFIIGLSEQAVRARYLRDATHVEQVDSENVLKTKLSSRAITLARDGAQESLDFAIQTTSDTPKELTFVLSFDQGGEKRLVTRRVVLWR